MKIAYVVGYFLLTIVENSIETIGSLRSIGAILIMEKGKRREDSGKRRVGVVICDYVYFLCVDFQFSM